MKKIKQNPTNKDKNNLALFKSDTKSARITIDSRIANTHKFNELFALLDNTKNLKNQISLFCFQNITFLVTDYHQFLTNYSLFTSDNLNSWEVQNIFQDIASHYHESSTRYLAKAKFIVNSNRFSKELSLDNKLSQLASLVFKDTNLTVSDNLTKIKPFRKSQLARLSPAAIESYNSKNPTYELDLDIPSKLITLNSYLLKHKDELIITQDKFNNLEVKAKEKDTLTKHIKLLNSLIDKYNKLINSYSYIDSLKISKPIIYDRFIQLIKEKKLRLLKKVKLGVYQTGTHSRSINNSQFAIVKDVDNKKYQYFIKIRKNNKLIGREPKLTEKNKDSHQKLVALYNENNFLFLPIIFNQKHLDKIGKKIEDILSKDNPQILLKSEQLRKGSKSRKIHIIFSYQEANPLGKVIEKLGFTAPNEDNTLACDVNLKHNLLADSSGKFYTQILTAKPNARNQFLDNLNEIVLLQAKPVTTRTEKERYRYEKLLRSNESLLKTYLSSLVKDWKSKGLLHLVLEDLNLLGDKTYYEHKGVKIKYSRLARLIRLSNIKTWLTQMGEKQELFVHLVNPAYTSQECNVCHYISPSNRNSQEIFECKNPDCNHKENADTNSAKNIKSRILNVKLRDKLGKNNVYLCSRVKPMYYKVVKTIIEETYGLGVITELVPYKARGNPFALITKQDVKANNPDSKKLGVVSITEASSFRTR